MNYKIVVAVIAIPIGIASLLTKSAAAADVTPTFEASQSSMVVAQRYDDRQNNDRREDLRQDELRREQIRRDELRREQIRREEAQRNQIRRNNSTRRIWIAGHYEPGFLGIGRKWVEGHWEDRR